MQWQLKIEEKKMIESINGYNRPAEVNFLRNIESSRSVQSDHSVGSDAGKAIQLYQSEKNSNADLNGVGAANETNASEERVDGSNNGPKTEGQLTDAEKKEVQELKETDRKVRQHEMAHLAAAAGIAISGANFEFKQGPDGVNYAVGGDVKIDVSKESDPDATIEKARKISATANAPADPSPQDRQVAAKARAMEAEAHVEKARQQREEQQEENTRGAADQQHPGIQAYQQNQSFAPFSGGNTNPVPASGTETPAFNAGAASAVAASSVFRLDLVA